LEEHWGSSLTEIQKEWITLIYDLYAVNGQIDWSDHSRDSAYYYFITEVCGVKEEREYEESPWEVMAKGLG
jgi:hypothetical protein